MSRNSNNNNNFSAVQLGGKGKSIPIQPKGRNNVAVASTSRGKQTKNNRTANEISNEFNRLNITSNNRPRQFYNGNTKLSNLNDFNSFIVYLKNKWKYNKNLTISDKKNIKNALEISKKNNSNMTLNTFLQTQKMKRINSNIYRNNIENARLLKMNNENVLLKKKFNHNNSKPSTSTGPASPSRPTQQKNMYLKKLVNNSKTSKKLLILYEISRKYVPNISTMYKNDRYRQFIQRFSNNVIGDGRTKKCEYNFYKSWYNTIDFHVLLWLDTYHDYATDATKKQNFPTFVEYGTKLHFITPRELTEFIRLHEEEYKKNNKIYQNQLDLYDKSFTKFALKLGIIQLKIEKTGGKSIFDLKIVDLKSGELEKNLKDNLVNYCVNYCGYDVMSRPLSITGRGSTSNKKYYMILDQQQESYFTLKGFNNLETLATLADLGRYQKSEPNKPTSEKAVALAIYTGNTDYIRFNNFYLNEEYKIILNFNKKKQDGQKIININLKNPITANANKSSIYITTNWFGNSNKEVQQTTAKNVNINNSNSILFKALGDLNQAFTMCTSDKKDTKKTRPNWYQASQDILHIYSLLNLYRVSGESPKIMTVLNSRVKYIVKKDPKKEPLNRNLKRYGSTKTVSHSNSRARTMTTHKDLEQIRKRLPQTIRNSQNYKIHLGVYNSEKEPIKKRNILIKYVGNLMNKNITLQVPNGNNTLKNITMSIYDYLFRTANKSKMTDRQKIRTKQQLWYIRNKAKST